MRNQDGVTNGLLQYCTSEAARSGESGKRRAAALREMAQQSGARKASGRWQMSFKVKQSPQCKSGIGTGEEKGTLSRATSLGTRQQFARAGRQARGGAGSAQPTWGAGELGCSLRAVVSQWRPGEIPSVFCYHCSGSDGEKAQEGDRLEMGEATERACVTSRGGTAEASGRQQQRGRPPPMQASCRGLHLTWSKGITRLLKGGPDHTRPGTPGSCFCSFIRPPGTNPLQHRPTLPGSVWPHKGSNRLHCLGK